MAVPTRSPRGAGRPPSDEQRERTARLWFWRIWAAIGALVLAYLAWQVLDAPLAIIGPPLALAALIVYVLDPFVRGLRRRGVPRVLGASIAYLVLIGGVVGAGILLGPIIAEQVSGLAERAPDIAVDLQRTINRRLASLGVDARVNLDPQSDDVRDTLQRYLFAGQAGDQLSEVLSGAGEIARGILHAAVIILLGPVLAFYLLADLPNLLRGMRRLIPPEQRDEVVGIVEGIAGRVGGYFRGQLAVATFVGVATSIGLAIVGLPFWALVGITTGVFNIVPLIGPFVGGAIGVIIALTAGDGFSQAIWVVVVMTAVQQVDNHVISPNVMSRTVDLHPITVMLALLVAGTLYGILGMLVAVPAVAAMKLVALHMLATRADWADPELGISSVRVSASASDPPSEDQPVADGAAEPAPVADAPTAGSTTTPR